MAQTIEGKQAQFVLMLLIVKKNFSLTHESAIESSVNVDLVARHIAYKKLLIMTAQYDAPKITEQNNILIKKLLKYKDINFKQEVKI